LAQIIGAGYRSQDAKICRAQYSSKPFPEQNAFSNENDRKGTLPTHGAVSNPACEITFVTLIATLSLKFVEVE
jgi:hypothetical protein